MAKDSISILQRGNNRVIDSLNRQRQILRVLAAFLKVGTVISLISLAFFFKEAFIVLLSYAATWLLVYRPFRIRLQTKYMVLNLDNSMKDGYSEIKYIRKPDVNQDISEQGGILPTGRKKGFIAREQLTFRTNEYVWHSVDLNYYTDKSDSMPTN